MKSILFETPEPSFDTVDTPDTLATGLNKLDLESSEVFLMVLYPSQLALN